MDLKTLSGFSFLACLAACQPAPGEEASRQSSTPAEMAPTDPVDAVLVAADGSSAGHVILRHGPRGLLITVEGENWPEGWHGVHVHAVGRCDPPTFESADGHLNETAEPTPHGLLNFDGGPDYGDLQNVYATAAGTARAEVYLPTAQASGHGIEGGLSLIVHANRDDHVSQPIGGAGDRIACAVLIAEPTRGG